MDMVSDAFVGTLKKSLTEGKVTEEAINAACRRILEAKYKLGLFDNPYKYCDVKRAKKQIFTKEHRAVARKIASESLVLLKNERLGFCHQSELLQRISSQSQPSTPPVLKVRFLPYICGKGKTCDSS